MVRKDVVGFMVTQDGRTPLAAEPERLMEFAIVCLKADLTYDGLCFPKGTRGVIVHKHNEEDFEVEFHSPHFRVITLNRAEINLVP